MDTFSSFGIETVMVSENMTHLLQPLDLTTNDSFKKRNEKRASREYFTSSIMEALQTDPVRDVTTVKVVVTFVDFENSSCERYH